MEVHRNYFGSQLASFEAPLILDHSIAESFVATSSVGGSGAAANASATARPCFTGVFIRAPAILTVGEGARPVAWVRAPRQDAHVPVLPSAASSSCAASAAAPTGAEPVVVAVQQGPFLVTAFHPELTGDHSWHRLFASQVAATTGKKILGEINATQAAQSSFGSSSPAIYADRNLTPGTSALSSFKYAAPDRSTATTAGSGSSLPAPVGLVGSDEGTGGHALSHAIAHRVICYPPSSGSS